MKTSVLLATVTLGIAGVAGAQTYSPLDANKNGKVELSEFQTARTGLIMSADKDGDGRVSAQELAQADGEAQGKPRPRVDDVFRRLDADKDGYLTKAEADTAVARRFKALDVNGDGVLETAELHKWDVPPGL